jgi:hypothetical protein
MRRPRRAGERAPPRALDRSDVLAGCAEIMDLSQLRHSLTPPNVRIRLRAPPDSERSMKRSFPAREG